VEKTDYVLWRTRLEQHVLESQDNALFPLLHFVLDDLPTSTKSAELDDSNMVRFLKRSRWQSEATVNSSLMGLYLSWLVAAGFLPAPSGENGSTLPTLNGVSTKAVGRTGT